MHNNDSFAFTSDSWTTSCNKTIHWCSLTVHLISSDFVLKRCLMDVMQLPYSSTNTAILEIWEDCFKKYNLKKANVAGIVLDGGGNFQLAGKRFAENTSGIVLWCACHRLNLVTKFLFKNGPDELKKLFTIANKIVAKYNRSFQFSFTFKEQQILFGTKGTLILPIGTRWNSYFDMLRSLASNQSAVEATLIAEGEEGLELTSREWTIMSAVVTWSSCITKPLDFLQGDLDITVDEVFVKLCILDFTAKEMINQNQFQGNESLKGFGISLGNTLVKALEKYFPKNEKIDKQSGVYSQKKYKFIVSVLIFQFGQALTTVCRFLHVG